MNQTSTFFPPRSTGFLFLSASILILAGLSWLALSAGISQPAGSFFVLLLLLAVGLFAPLPVLAYQFYALLRARYQIDRDSLFLRWGMRAETIPLADVEWARPVEDLAMYIPSPWLRLPGALSGTVTVEGLGPIEYMAADRQGLVLVATHQKIYAISPEDQPEFLRAFQQAFELGSLAHVSGESVLPAAYLAQVWADRLARSLLVAGLLLAVLMLIFVSLAIPTHAEISLGFYPDGRGLPPVPAAQLLLLPVIGAVFYIIDLGAGLFFYRNPVYRLLGYIVWSSSIATSLLLAGAALWIL